MKKNILTATLLAMPLMFFTACSDFLDTAPDNRIEINNTDQITPFACFCLSQQVSGVNG